MSKDLTSLEALQEICGYYYQSPQYKLVENALKALEIIKKKEVCRMNKGSDVIRDGFEKPRL